MATPVRARLTLAVRAPYRRARLSGEYHLSSIYTARELLAEADAATGRTLRDYIWLPQGDISPAADNDNEEGAASPPLPLALVTGVNTGTSALLAVHADHLNRPTRLTDATRATVWSASYDPFGQPVSIAGPVEQNLRFPGQYFLIESGLSYNWHRFYDPTTGRYTQPDPLRFVDGPSLYGYVGASPMMQVDRLGLQEDRRSFIGIPSPFEYSPRLDGQTDLFHNFPRSFDLEIWTFGWFCACNVTPSGFYYQRCIEGAITGTRGVFELGFEFNLLRGESYVTHRLFRPYKKKK